MYIVELVSNEFFQLRCDDRCSIRNYSLKQENIILQAILVNSLHFLARNVLHTILLNSVHSKIQQKRNLCMEQKLTRMGHPRRLNPPVQSKTWLKTKTRMLQLMNLSENKLYFYSVGSIVHAHNRDIRHCGN